MFCDQCGKRNEDGSKFCVNCGSPLIKEKTSERRRSEKGSAEKKTTEKRTTDKRTTEKKTTAYKRTADTTSAQKKSKSRKTAETGKTADIRKSSVSAEELAAMENELKQLNKSKSPLIALIVALLVFAVALAVLFIKLPKLYGAEQEVTGFETAMLSGNWEDAYAYLYMEGEASPFLSKDMFVQVMSRTGASGFRNLVVQEAGTLEDKKVFSVSYETSEGTENTTVTMCPTGNKKLLFLDEWKVDPATVCISNVKVTIPSEASLRLNGLDPETEPVENAAEQSREYTFAKLFAGIWQAELKAENRADYYTDITVSKDVENGVISLIGAELYPDQALMDSILSQFTQDYQAILEASVNREDFSVVEKYFASDAIQEGRAQNMYANACSQAYNPETGSGIVGYELSDITATFVPIVKSSYAKTGDLVMEIQSTLTYTYIDEGVEKSDTQTSKGLLCYHQENDQWKIQSFN